MEKTFCIWKNKKIYSGRKMYLEKAKPQDNSLHFDTMTKFLEKSYTFHSIKTVEKHVPLYRHITLKLRS